LQQTIKQCVLKQHKLHTAINFSSQSQRSTPNMPFLSDL